MFPEVKTIPNHKDGSLDNADSLQSVSTPSEEVSGQTNVVNFDTKSLADEIASIGKLRLRRFSIFS